MSSKRGFQYRGYLPPPSGRDTLLGRGFPAARSHVIPAAFVGGPTDPKLYEVKMWDGVSTVRYGALGGYLGVEHPTSVPDIYVPAVGPGTGYALGLTPGQYLELFWRVEEIHLSATGGTATAASSSVSFSGSAWSYDPATNTSFKQSATGTGGDGSLSLDFPADLNAAAGGAQPARLSRAPRTIDSQYHFELFPRPEAWLPLRPPLQQIFSGVDSPDPNGDPERDVAATFEAFDGGGSAEQYFYGSNTNVSGSSVASIRSILNVQAGFYERPYMASWVDDAFFVEGKFWLSTPVTTEAFAGARFGNSRRVATGTELDRTNQVSEINREHAKLIQGGLVRSSRIYSRHGTSSDISAETMTVRYEHRPGHYVVGDFIAHETAPIDGEIDSSGDAAMPPLQEATLTVSLPTLTITPSKWFTYGGIYNPETGERAT